MPAAEHPADLIEWRRKRGVFPGIERFRFPQHKKQDFDSVQFADGQAYVRQFLLTRRETCRRDGFDALDQDAIDALGERVAMRFRDGRIISEPEQIGGFELLQDWQNRQGGVTSLA